METELACIDGRDQIKHFYTWCVINKLIMNSNKTNFVLFHTMDKRIPTNVNNIQTGFIGLDRVSFFNYIGVMLDKAITWQNHIEDLENP